MGYASETALLQRRYRAWVGGDVVQAGFLRGMSLYGISGGGQLGVAGIGLLGGRLRAVGLHGDFTPLQVFTQSTHSPLLAHFCWCSRVSFLVRQMTQYQVRHALAARRLLSMAPVRMLEVSSDRGASVRGF